VRCRVQNTTVRFSDADVAANRVRLAIAALAAVACLAAIHRAILAGLLARGLVRRQCGCAYHGGDNGTDNFRVPLHTHSNVTQLRDKNFVSRDDFGKSFAPTNRKFHSCWRGGIVVCLQFNCALLWFI
jgi:hypothetical protein